MTTTLTETPHQYQSEAICSVLASLQPGNAVVLVAPTGSGKTLIAGRVASNFSNVLFVAHRREILKQAEKHMPPGTHRLSISAALKFNCDIDMLIIDECHRSGAPTYRALTEKFAQASRLGLTATPLRMDGRGLCDAFDQIVECPSLKELVASGHLVPYVLPLEPPDEALRRIGAIKEAIGAIKTVRGDYDQRELGAVMGRPRLVGSVVGEYRKWATGRKAIVFAVNVKHSKALKSEFISAGFKAEHIDGRASESTRSRALKDLAEGRIDVLCSVNLFTEGWDCPEVSCVIMARPTQSLTLYLQSVGRGMRKCEGKADLMIIDHAGNIARHGYPDEDREWSLEGKAEKAKREREVAELERLYARGIDRTITSLEEYELEQKRLSEQVYYSARQVADLLPDIKHHHSFLKTRGVGPSSTNGQLSTYLRAEVDPIVAEFRGSYSSINVAKLFGMSRSAAKQLLRSAGIKEIRANTDCRWPKALVDDLLNVYSGCIPIGECVAILGRSPEHTRDIMRDAGVFTVGKSGGTRYRRTDVESLAFERAKTVVRGKSLK